MSQPRLIGWIGLLTFGGVLAQDEVVPAPQPVSLEAADGLMLMGAYYAAGDEPRPAVLLLHMVGSRRQAWEPLIPSLLAAGYNALAVDLRGHGETGGTADWPVAVGDVPLWLDWLRAQPGVRPEAVSLVGASIGANLALIGGAADPDCVTAGALSPGLDFYGLMPEAAVVEGLSDRPALLVATHGDTESAQAVEQMLASATGEISAMIFPGSAHGTSMFAARRLDDRVFALIVNWLDDHTPPAA